MTKTLLKLGPDVKDAVLAYVSLCLRKNEARAKMQVRWRTCGSVCAGAAEYGAQASDAFGGDGHVPQGGSAHGGVGRLHAEPGDGAPGPVRPVPGQRAKGTHAPFC